MRTFKLANVIYDDTVFAKRDPALYCNASAPVELLEGEMVLHGPGTFDFTTYFNALSLAKWRAYTVVDEVRLHLELSGGPASVDLTHAGPFSFKSETFEDAGAQVEASEAWRPLELSYEGLADEVVAFSVRAEGVVRLRNACYTALVEDREIRDVELALATTTFRKEDFVVSNVGLLKERVLGADDAVASHLTVHIVDNGRTLDVRSLESERVLVHPNDNVGGSGGFARGMIEAMRQTPKATHVLLMDDDVAVSPESIVRTFNLLSLARDEYAEAFVSGAMLDYDVPGDQWEDLGRLDECGYCVPVKHRLRMGLLADIVENEEIDYRERERERDLTYAAWWYCCIPVATIEREGLPLPLFVRFDDVEYGLRCKPRFVTMNGICIWHVGFHTRYNACVERYQTTRNGFVLQAITGVARECDYLEQMRDSVQKELKKFNYRNAELILDGFEDFLKGPGFIMERGAVERAFMQRSAKQEKLLPFDELGRRLGTDIDSSLNRGKVYRDEPRTIAARALDFFMFNGQRGPLAPAGCEGIVVIPSEGGAYPAGKMHGATMLLAVDSWNKRGALRSRNRERFREVWKRYKADVRTYRRRKADLEASYAAVRDEITSVAWWKSYLGIE